MFVFVSVLIFCFIVNETTTHEIFPDGYTLSRLCALPVCEAGPGYPGPRSSVGHVRRRCLRAGADVAGACRTHLQPAAEEQQAQARCPARTGECIGKGKARMPYEFGVRTGIVKGLEVGVRSFLGNRSDERRVGKEFVSTCRSRGWPSH